MVPVESLQREHAVSVSIELVLKPPEIQVTVYGHREESDRVGDHLSTGGLFLQHPRAYDESTCYFNPQYLVPPGTEFEAAMETLDINEPSQTQKNTLSLAQRSRILAVLDETASCATFSEVTVSNGLRTALKGHVDHSRRW